MKFRLSVILVLVVAGLLITLGASRAQDAVVASSPADQVAVGDGYWECPIAPDSVVQCSMNTIYGAALIDGKNGWAVGEDGLLLRYRAGQWGQVAPLPADWVASVALKDINTGWAVGRSTDGRGGIYRLKDGQWNALNPVTTSPLQAVAINGSSAWAVGQGGVMAFFDGSEWLGLASPTTKALYSVALSSPTTGWAVGDGGTILRLNGSWAVASSPTTKSLYALALVSDSEGWAVGAQGALLRLSGGAWSVVQSPNSQTMEGIALADGNNGWAVGSSGTIWRLNAGTWQADVNPRAAANRTLHAVVRVNSGEAWAFGADNAYSRGQMLRLRTGSWEWYNRPYIEPWQIGNIAVVPGNAAEGWAYASGWNGSYDNKKYDIPLFVRLSGGSWVSSIPLPGGGEAWDLALINANTGWAVGKGGKIWRLSGGAWEAFPLGFTAANLNAIALTGLNDGWAVGDSGAILQLTGGAWRAVTPVGTENLNDVALSGNAGYMVGASGAIARYIPALGQWARVGSPTNTTLYSVAMASETEAWIGGAGAMLHLVDGVWIKANSESAYDVVLTGAGRGWAVYGSFLRLENGTWTRVRTDLPNGYALALADDGSGWGAASDGRPYRLIGGQWQHLAPLSASWNDVTLTAPGEGWALGDNGAIWRMASGGWQPWYSPTTADLQEAALFGPGNGWAVGGYPPTIVRLTGDTWSVSPLPARVDDNLYTIALSGNSGWALGWYTSVRLDNGIWTQEGDIRQVAYDVAFVGPNDGWAALHSSSSLLRLSGGVWQSVSAPTYETRNGIALSDASHGWAVGERNIFRLDGVWSVYGTTTAKKAVELSGPLDGWAVGNDFGRLKAGQWTMIASPQNSLLDIALSGADAGWAVGSSTHMLRYCPQAGCALLEPPEPTPTPTATPTRRPFTPDAFAYMPLILKQPTPTATQPPDYCARYEPNDTLSSAWGALSSGQTLDAALCSGDSDDYYYVDLPVTAQLTVQLTNIPAGADYDLILYNQSAQTIAESRQGGSTSEQVTKPLNAGRYFIRVYPFNNRSSSPYRLSAAWSPLALSDLTAEPLMEQLAPAPDWGKPPLDAPVPEEGAP